MGRFGVPWLVFPAWSCDLSGVNGPERTLRQLSFFGVAALGAVAVLATAGQVVVQTSLGSQRADSRVINLAGRQRMLSQKIAKTAVALSSFPAPKDAPALRRTLAADAEVWRRAQQSLRDGDPELGLPSQEDPRIRDLFDEIAPHHRAILDGVAVIVAEPDRSTAGARAILEHEAAFLLGMDDLVFELDRVARQKVVALSTLEVALLALTLVVLLLEGLLVFRPLLRRVWEAVDAERRHERSFVEATEALQVRLGQELHDGVCQQLAGIAMFARAEQRGAQGGSPVSAEAVEQIASLVEDANQQARAVALGLYPAALTDRSLSDVLGDLGRQNRSLGFEVDVDAASDLDVSRSAALHLYRITQESLSNARRHGQARRAQVALFEQGREIVLTVKDDGRGLDPDAPTTGLGLRTMRHRASLLGGRLEISAAPETGTTVRVEIPRSEPTDSTLSRDATRMTP